MTARMVRSSILVLNALLLAFPSVGASEPLLRLHEERGAVVDSAGRTVLLHGVNLGKKGTPFLPDRTEEDYAALGRWGMNCVRFYINWAGIEPEPGKYDDTLLAGLDQHIGWANAHGLYVLLDLHQDLYSGVVPGGNGAPVWATLDDGKPHVMPEGAPWGVAYATSPKVHQAFDSFWENRPGPGGVGLQDRFAAMARHVAARYAGNPGVAGIDLFNEPGLGSDITKVLPALVDALPALAALPDPPAGLLGLLTRGGAANFLEKFGARTDIYLWGVDAMTPPLQAFETGKLQPFYDRVGQAVRTVTQDALLFFEPGVLANSGARSGLRPLQAADGRRLPNQVYAAHVYDLVTDTPYVDKADETRVSIMFERVREHAREMGLPVVIGEWGGYYGNARARPAAQSVVAQFEKHLAGDLYWDYESKQESKAYFDQLCRPYPMAVAGVLKAMAFNQETRVLSVRWTEHANTAAPTRLYLPKVWFKEKPPLLVTPDSVVTWTEIPGEDAGWRVDIAPLEAGGEREATAGGAQVTEIVSVSSPPLLLRHDSGAAHVLVAKVIHRGAACTAEVRVGEVRSSIELKEGTQTVEVFVPPVNGEKTVEMVLARDGAVLASAPVPLVPVRPWEIRIIHQTHLDIGFTHKQEDVLKVQVGNLRDALRFIEETKEYPEEARFRFHPEGMWAVEEFMRTAAEDEKKSFLDACRAGNIHLDVLYAQAMTGMYNDEELVELMGAAKRFEKTYGVPITSAMQSDVPGYTWGLVTVLAQCGVPYLSVGPNWFATGGVDDFFTGEGIAGKTHRGGLVFRWADQPFWWEGPSGKERVLFWMPGWGYSGFQCGRDAITPEKVSAYLNWLESKKYPYDMVMWRYAVGADNGPAWRALSDIVRDWNAKYASPRLVISTNSGTMRDFAQRYGGQLPVLRGDFTPYWEDGCASTSKATGVNRAAAERLVQAQTLWAMRRPALPLHERFDEAWNKAIMYDEHTWGAHNSISEPDSPFAIQQDAFKQAYAFDCEKLSHELMEDIAKPEENAKCSVFDVTNTTSWTRDGLIICPSNGVEIVDGGGKPVPAQVLASNELAFVARDVPAFGARRYTVREGVGLCTGSVKAEGLTLSSDLLTIRIDPKTGAVASLRRKGIADDLVDSEKGSGLNDYLYILGRDAGKNRQGIEGDVKVAVEDKGPVVGTIRIESAAPGCEKLVRRVRIVDGLDYVELFDDVKKARERNPEGVYFGFPFNIPGAEARIDTPWAVVRAEKDQLEGANRNYYCVQRWVDVSNAEHGVTWVTPDAPMLQFDPIKIALPFGLDQWREHIEPGAFFYSWTMNNHWETNYKADQEGWISFRYILRPHTGGYDAVREQQFGRGICQPLRAVLADPAKPVPAPLLTLSEPGVIVTSIRPTRDGRAFLVRLFNTTEETRTVALTWGRPMGAPWISNPMEDAVSPAGTPISLIKYEMLTLRVELG